VPVAAAGAAFTTSTFVATRCSGCSRFPSTLWYVSSVAIFASSSKSLNRTVAFASSLSTPWSFDFFSAATRLYSGGCVSNQLASPSDGYRTPTDAQRVFLGQSYTGQSGPAESGLLVRHRIACHVVPPNGMKRASECDHRTPPVAAVAATSSNGHNSPRDDEAVRVDG